MLIISILSVTSLASTDTSRLITNFGIKDGGARRRTRCRSRSGGALKSQRNQPRHKTACASSWIYDGVQVYCTIYQDHALDDVLNLKLLEDAAKPAI